MGPIALRYVWAKRTARDEEDRQAHYKRLHAHYAPKVRRLVGELRGMWAKCAQVASMIPDMLPEEYRAELRHLHDAVQPADWDAVRRVLEADLGAPIGETFEAVDPKPLGSASLGQAHLVTYQGRKLIVKVQYPDAAEHLRADFDSLEAFVGLMDRTVLPMVRKMRQQFELEVDYMQEARHLRSLHSAILEAPEFADRIAVPRPVDELTRGRVLGMEYLPGPKLDTVLLGRLRALGVDTGGKSLLSVIEGLVVSGASQASSGGREKGSDAAGAGDSSPAVPRPMMRLANSFVGQVAAALLGPDRVLWLARNVAEARLCCKRRLSSEGLPAAPGASTHELRSTLRLLLQVHGFQIFFSPYFNGDPHPGNLLALPDGRIGLIDMGQCAEVSHGVKLHLAHLFPLVLQPPSTEVDDEIVRILHKMGVRTEKDERRYKVWVCRAMFGKLKKEWFVGTFFKDMLQLDRIVEQPIEFLMISRTANLLRGFGHLMMENVSLAEAWQPWGERWLQENGLAPRGAPSASPGKAAHLEQPRHGSLAAAPPHVGA